MENNKTNQLNQHKPKDRAKSSDHNHPKTEEKRMTELNFDQAFKNKFDDFESTPPPKVWKVVRKKLPLNLYIKRQLNVLSRIAAVLLFAMLIAVVFDQNQQAPLLVQHDADPQLNAVSDLQSEYAASSNNPEFVFDLSDKKTMPAKRKKKKNRIRHSSDLEELWAELLDDNPLEDESLIDQLINPIESLPLQKSIASIPIIPEIQLYPEEESHFIPTEIEIKIPLKIESNINIE